MTVLVGITGRAGVGKSMVADGLVRLADYDVISIATPLKVLASSFLRDAYGYGQEDVDFHLRNKEIKISRVGVSMRHVLQTLGTNWGRQLINPNMWVNLAADEISSKLDFSSVVVDDVRFEDEAQMIRGFGGLIIHLHRPGWSGDVAHVSEAGIAVHPGDVVVVNDGSELDLMQAVSRAIDRFVSGSDELLRLCLTPSRSYAA